MGTLRRCAPNDAKPLCMNRLLHEVERREEKIVTAGRCVKDEKPQAEREGDEKPSPASHVRELSTTPRPSDRREAFTHELGRGRGHRNCAEVGAPCGKRSTPSDARARAGGEDRFAQYQAARRLRPRPGNTLTRMATDRAGLPARRVDGRRAPGRRNRRAQAGVGSRVPPSVPFSGSPCINAPRTWCCVCSMESTRPVNRAICHEFTRPAMAPITAATAVRSSTMPRV